MGVHRQALAQVDTRWSYLARSRRVSLAGNPGRKAAGPSPRLPYSCRCYDDAPGQASASSKRALGSACAIASARGSPRRRSSLRLALTEARAAAEHHQTGSVFAAISYRPARDPAGGSVNNPHATAGRRGTRPAARLRRVFNPGSVLRPRAAAARLRPEVCVAAKRRRKTFRNLPDRI